MGAIISKAVQRVSRQFGAPSGPSPSGGSLSFTCQPTGETHSKSLRFQGSPLVPPSLGGATDLGPSSLAEVHQSFLGQDSLVQAPVLEIPAYSPLSHSPSLNFTMENGMSCRLPGCNYSTTSQMSAEAERYLHCQLFEWHMLDRHFRITRPPEEASVSNGNVITSDGTFIRRDNIPITD